MSVFFDVLRHLCNAVTFEGVFRRAAETILPDGRTDFPAVGEFSVRDARVDMRTALDGVAQICVAFEI